MQVATDHAEPDTPGRRRWSAAASAQNAPPPAPKGPAVSAIKEEALLTVGQCWTHTPDWIRQWVMVTS